MRTIPETRPGLVHRVRTELDRIALGELRAARHAGPAPDRDADRFRAIAALESADGDQTAKIVRTWLKAAAAAAAAAAVTDEAVGEAVADVIDDWLPSACALGYDNDHAPWVTFTERVDDHDEPEQDRDPARSLAEATFAAIGVGPVFDRRAADNVVGSVETDLQQFTFARLDALPSAAAQHDDPRRHLCEQVRALLHSTCDALRLGQPGRLDEHGLMLLRDCVVCAYDTALQVSLGFDQQRTSDLLGVSGLLETSIEDAAQWMASGDISRFDAAASVMRVHRMAIDALPQTLEPEPDCAGCATSSRLYWSAILTSLLLVVRSIELHLNDRRRHGAR